MNLIDSAHDLALEIRDGVWAHVDCLRVKPAAACPEIIDELRRRSPGHSLEQYQKAIADGLFGTR